METKLDLFDEDRSKDLHVALDDELLINMVPRHEGCHVNCDDDVELTQLDGELGPLSIDFWTWHVDVVDLLAGEVTLVC